MTPEFIFTSFIFAVTPGISVIFTMGAGLSRGRRASLVAAIGCTLGIVPHILAAVTGLAAVLHTSAVAFQTLKYLGVAYLIYMAWMTWRDHGPLSIDVDAAPKPTLQVIRSAILVNLLNPKLSIFFLAFLPQFVSANEAAPLWRMLELSTVFMIVAFAVFVGYGLFASAIRSRVLSRPAVLTWLRRVFAGAFAALGARLALTER